MRESKKSEGGGGGAFKAPPPDRIGLSGYDVKPRFGAFQCEYLLKNTLFFQETILVTLDTHTKK